MVLHLRAAFHLNPRKTYFYVTQGNYQIVDFADLKNGINSNQILNENDFKLLSKKIRLKKDLSLFEVEEKLKQHLSSPKVYLVIRKAMRKSVIQPKVLNARKTIRQENTTPKKGEPDKSTSLNMDQTDHNKSEAVKREMVNGFKTLSDLYVTPNQLIFVDRSDTQGKSEWVEYFKRENHMIVLNFNYPEQEGNTSDKVNYKFQMKVDMRKRLCDLKHDLMNKIQTMKKLEEKKAENNLEITQETGKPSFHQIPVQETRSSEIAQDSILQQLIQTQKMKETHSALDFIMKKGGRSGIELKDLRKTIRQKGFINNSFLYLIFGRVSIPGEISVNLHLCLDPSNADTFQLKRHISKFGEIHIRNNWKADQLVSHIKQTYPVLGDKNFLLREMVTNVPTKVFRNYSLKRQYVVDRKKILLEFSDQQMPDKDEIFVYYCVLSEAEEVLEEGDLKKLVLGPVREIRVNRQNHLREAGGLMLGDMARVLENKKQNPKEPEEEPNTQESNQKKRVLKLTPPDSQLTQLIANGVENLTCTKIKDVGNFVKEDIIDHRFFSLNHNDKILSSAPFYLDLDGCLFILKRKGLQFSETLKGAMRANSVRNENFWGKAQGPEKQLEIFVKTRSPKK